MSGKPMRRREFITLLGGAAAAWPLAAWAQQDERQRRVGVLMINFEADPDGQTRLQMFRQGLADLGWVEGRNLRIDLRWGGGQDAARQRAYAHELVALAPDVVLVNSTTATQALRDATRTIPIVFVNLFDPVLTGVVSNLARPEANVTGFMAYEYSLAGKWLNLLKDMAPRLARVAVLFHPETAYAPFYARAAQDAGERLALKITTASLHEPTAIEPAIAAMAGSGDGGLLIIPDGGFNIFNRTTTIALAAKYRVPAIYYDRLFSATGGLISYGTNQRLQYRDGATYVDRILRGAKPGELPVQFASKFELVINLKTAKALDLDVSQQLQFLADEVIE
jgi:putative ABC transport system substrate-binding protein